MGGAACETLRARLAEVAARRFGCAPAEVVFIGGRVCAGGGAQADVAFADIGRDFHGASLSDLSWVLNGYAVLYAALLVPLAGGGYVVDTPGLREVGAWGIDPELLALCFPEFRRFLDQCRFDDCRHLAEPGCAVRQAAAQHDVAPDRLESYQRVYEEINVPSWSSGRRRAR